MKSKEILPEEERKVIVELKLTNNYHFLKTYKALQAAESELDEKDKEIARLKEYEWMYNQLCK